MIAARARSDQDRTFVEGFSHSWGNPQPGAFAPLFAPEIRLVARRGIDRFLLRHGQAVERLHYFDTRPLMQQAARLPRAWPGLLRAGARPRPPCLEKPGQQAGLAAAPPIVRAWAELWRAPSSEGLAAAAAAKSARSLGPARSLALYREPLPSDGGRQAPALAPSRSLRSQQRPGRDHLRLPRHLSAGCSPRAFQAAASATVGAGDLASVREFR
jgi:hypothetical protein